MKSIPSKIIYFLLVISLLIISGCSTKINTEEKTTETAEKVPEATEIQVPTPNQTVTVLPEVGENEMAILDNRLIITVPEGSENQLIQESIMGAPHSDIIEASISYRDDDKYLNIYAKQLNETSKGSIEEDAAIILSRYSEECVVNGTKTKNGLIIANFTPKELAQDENGKFVKGAIVKCPDDSYILINCFISHSTDEKEYTRYIDAALDSMRFGGKQFNLEPHTEQFTDMSISLEKNYFIFADYGPDFEVYYIYKFVPIGEISPSMLIYNGGHPSFDNALRDADFDVNVSGKETNWKLTGDLNKISSETRLEALIEKNKDAYDAYLHIVLYPESEVGLKELEKMASSFKIS